VVADSRVASCPVMIYKPGNRYKPLPIISPHYKHNKKDEHRICLAAISPAFFGALFLFRDGTLKFANWSRGKEYHSVEEIAEGERLEEETKKIRGTSSIAFTEDGMRALAVDREGKVLAMRFRKPQTGNRSP
jgi:hypothetical protein